MEKFMPSVCQRLKWTLGLMLPIATGASPPSAAFISRPVVSLSKSFSALAIV